MNTDSQTLTDNLCTVNTNGQSFQQIFSGQWSGLNQALSLMAKPYKRGGEQPSVDDSGSWKSYDLMLSSKDSNWGSQTTLSSPGNKGAVAADLNLYFAQTDKDVVFTSRFYRKVYTGKTVWQDGGWVQETRWEVVGPALGETVLKLEPPTFASGFEPSQFFSSLQENYNKEDNDGKSSAGNLSQTLLYPESYSGRTVEFEGSKITSISKSDGPVNYNWNYDGEDGSQYVAATFPVTVKLHAVISTTFDSIPLPMKTEADFECTKVYGQAKRTIGGDSWKGDGLSYNADVRSNCKTAEGKTPDDIVKGIQPAIPSGKDLMKQFGF